MTPLQAARRLRNGLRVCASPVAQFRLEFNLWRAKPGELVEARLKSGNCVSLRAHTSDWSTVIDTFAVGYHRPLRPLPERSVIVDFGANAGYTLVDFRSMHPRARIVGVEMDEGNVELARLNTQGLGVELQQVAIFGSDGFVSYDSGQSADALRIDSTAPPTSRTEVPSMTVSTFLVENGIEHVDFLKVDIEGAEFDVLFNGDTEWLSKVDQMNLEVHTWTNHEFSDSQTGDQEVLQRVIELLVSRGMQVRVSTRHWSAIDAWRT